VTLEWGFEEDDVPTDTVPDGVPRSKRQATYRVIQPSAASEEGPAKLAGGSNVHTNRSDASRRQITGIASTTMPNSRYHHGVTVII